MGPNRSTRREGSGRRSLTTRQTGLSGPETAWSGDRGHHTPTAALQASGAVVGGLDLALDQHTPPEQAHAPQGGVAPGGAVVRVARDDLPAIEHPAHSLDGLDLRGPVGDGVPQDAGRGAGDDHDVDGVPGVVPLLGPIGGLVDGEVDLPLATFGAASHRSASGPSSGPRLLASTSDSPSLRMAVVYSSWGKAISSVTRRGPSMRCLPW